MASNLTPELKRQLETAGCRFERQGKGDHEIWYSPITDRRFPVDANIRSRHTANGILKQAGLPKAFQLLSTHVGICPRASVLSITLPAAS